MADTYDVLPLPVHLGSIVNKENNIIKPFVGVYFPVELLEKMGWTKDTHLALSVEKGFLKIYATGGDREENYYTFSGELTYEPIEEEL